MKKNEPLAQLVCLVALWSTLSVPAEEVAVVKDGRVNVRGQPSLVGEVITQLQKGDKVTVLEEMASPKGKTNEPAKWAKIQMPANTPVWLYAPFVDLTNKTVKVSRLNLRAGPGENYSVVGRLERGTAVNEIRRVEDWMEIETPPGAYGFVAADLLTKPELVASTAPAVAPAVTAPSKPNPLAAPATQELAKSEPAVSVPNPQVTPLQQAAPPEKPAVTTATQKPEPTTPPETPKSSAALQTRTEAPVVPPSVAVATPATTAPIKPQPTVTKPKSEEPLQTRIVRREGIVRSTISIQAPTYYELLSPQNRKTINYLHTDDLGLKLKDYRGRRIIVTGEEAIDPRWPKTPVIEVESLEVAP
jgi:uncharacterized protein YgiM (DUF1202 family)